VGVRFAGNEDQLRSGDWSSWSRLVATIATDKLLVVLAGVCGPVLALVTAGRTKGIRAIAALGVAAVIWGWGVAQYPVLCPARR
jgi:hypothetical protein